MILKMTFRSKLLSVLALTLVVAGTAAGITVARATTAAAPAAASAVSDAKLALARDYIATMPVENDVRAAVDQLGQTVPADQRVLFRSLADKSIDYTALKAAAIALAAEVFSEDELKAMTKFYSTPEGRSAAQKMGQYEERMQPVMVQTLQGFVSKLQENNIQVGAPQ